MARQIVTRHKASFPGFAATVANYEWVAVSTAPVTKPLPGSAATVANYEWAAVPANVTRHSPPSCWTRQCHCYELCSSC
ncbi:hypothetical protein AVEN_242508-1 [Araneus ventricosus]|uniref:Uncharacterized protein n=1 Tax=Araneus ventricosus TaxID=182803 RepID=A0A4Y2V9G2_ARAVE|nr:hypothetical protein AVEN_242508-1 [Araneus ventricosus]